MSPRKTIYYAVNKGRTPGVYTSWAQCAAQVQGFSNAVYQKFRTLAEAEQFVVDDATQSEEPSLSGATLTSTSSASARQILVVDSGEWDTAYCEAHQSEDGSVGIAVWWGENDTKNLSERCPGLESLERGELVAVVRALENLPPGNSSLLLKTTSLRCIKHIHRCFQLMKAEGQAEGVTLLNMPLSVYIPRLLARIRRQGRRIRFQHVGEYSAVEERGKQNARALALQGIEKEGERRVWALPEESDEAINRLQTSLASLEIEV